MWQLCVLCARCGERNDCGREISEPCEFALVCSGCEQSLMVTVTPADLEFQREADAYETNISFHLMGVPSEERFSSLPGRA